MFQKKVMKQAMDWGEVGAREAAVEHGARR